MVAPKANQPKRLVNLGSANTSVRIPELYNIELSNETVPESVLEFLLFEQIGGQELLSVSRSEILNGQNVSYSVVSNLSDVASQYSSENILSLPGTMPDLFKVYGLVLENYIPGLEFSTLDLSSKLPNESPNSYVDIDDSSNTKNSLIIEFKNMQANYEVEVQVMASGLVEDTVV
jgi:hypothetical protein